MSTSLNSHVDIQHRPSSMIDDLRQRAFVDKADTEVYGVRRWVNSVIKLYEQVNVVVKHTRTLFRLADSRQREMWPSSTTTWRAPMSRI